VRTVALLEYPTDYPIKVVGRPEGGFRLRIDAIFERHAGPLPPGRVSETASGKGNYVSITYTIVATGNEQVIALVEELAATEGVLMVI
jgi:putative lipoic acid-binding regulatory protein